MASPNVEQSRENEAAKVGSYFGCDHFRTSEDMDPGEFHHIPLAVPLLLTPQLNFLRMPNLLVYARLHALYTNAILCGRLLPITSERNSPGSLFPSIRHSATMTTKRAPRASADDLDDVEGPDQQQSIHHKPNAFTELMKPTPKPEPKAMNALPSLATRNLHNIRDGLGLYINDPDAFPDRVVYYNDKFVVIKDMFPKASVHLLILPRDKRKQRMAPQRAFDDREFLEDCRKEEKIVRQMAAEELRRQFAQYSKSDQERIAAMESADPPDELPAGRNWTDEVKSGIHANPSMSHLHIHVLSRDMVGEKMKKPNHYQSFTTDFLIEMDQFPLATDDYRRNYGHFTQNDLICWRCGKNFGRHFAELQKHLAEEFKEWVKE